MSAVNIWVAGATGRIGTILVKELDTQGISYFATGREVDVTDVFAVNTFIKHHAGITHLVNCVAYTAVDAAEEGIERFHAQILNELASSVLASICKQHNIAMIHLSTSYVFDGMKQTPYIEEDEMNPHTVYGMTKAKGEMLVRHIHDKHIILRLITPFGVTGKDFVNMMLRDMNVHNEMRIVNDQVVTPTYAMDIAKTVLHICLFPDTQWGTYHYSASGSVTFFEYANILYEEGRTLGLIKNVCKLFPKTTAESGAKAARPANAVMDITKIKKSI